MAGGKIVGIVQARMGSTRLPGKTLADLHGKPLLQRVIERTKAGRHLRTIVVATTANAEDDAIVEFCRWCGVECFRGSEEDVLDRYYQCADWCGAEIIARITADDPFKDPQVMDKVVDHLLAHPELDYASNNLEPTYPEGLDTEVLTRQALSRAWREARLLSDREHVTPYIWRHPHLFRVASVKHTTDLSHLRWTIDVEEDLAFARQVYARLNHRGLFLMDDILALLQAEPQLAAINQGIPRNQGYVNSLRRQSETA